MHDLRVGMKIYDNVWFLRYGLDPEPAADVLASMGVTFVLAQSKLLPMQDTAIESEVTPAEAKRFATLNDRAFRDALKSRGISYFASLNFGFDPKLIAGHPEALPIDQFGRREEKVDWYIALPPDRKVNIDHKLGLLKSAVQMLEPDGVHLGFIRWPGFWEIWLNDVKRADMPDYCYGPETLARFCDEARVDVPVNDPVTAARIIAEKHREAWRDWKCGQTVKTVGHVRSTLRAIKADLQIVINTLPFFLTDFDNAVEEVFGQSPAKLNEVADIFEVMAYHQILRRDSTWPGAIASDIKRRSGKEVVCTVQGSPLYLTGMHANRGRAETLSTEEFLRCVDSVEKSEADGVCVFTFTDFLSYRETTEGERRIERLKRFRR